MRPFFRYSTRLNSFRARPDLFTWQSSPRSTLDLIARAGQVATLDSVELNYPEHFVNHSLTEIQDALAKTHLTVSGINLRYDAAQFLDGGFINPQPAKRADAIALTCEAIDLCHQLGGKHVVVWPAYDGFDYPFAVDYAQSWQWTLDALQAIANHAANYAGELSVSIEYKPCEPRKFSLLGTIGLTLLAIEESATPLGVTLDFSHLLMAGEHPALSAALCIRKNKLFGIHLNDGYGQLDDGLLVGSVHFAQTLELIDLLVKAKYSGVIYFDTFPMREDPVQECLANVQRVEQMVALCARLDHKHLQEAINQQDGFATNVHVWETLLKK